uniref:Uncharacterized protein LOC104235318 n=1 Tax=Nicotiana sylvestris TaxID=4096 RepID=A0A1U7X919_NICSY|nr:PREDICTED: uncharacterized protein LOC104235318 [Nicotiana sylvestris]
MVHREPTSVITFNPHSTFQKKTQQNCPNFIHQNPNSTIYTRFCLYSIYFYDSKVPKVKAMQQLSRYMSLQEMARDFRFEDLSFPNRGFELSLQGNRTQRFEDLSFPISAGTKSRSPETNCNRARRSKIQRHPELAGNELQQPHFPATILLRHQQPLDLQPSLSWAILDTTDARRTVAGNFRSGSEVDISTPSLIH